MKYWPAIRFVAELAVDLVSEALRDRKRERDTRPVGLTHADAERQARAAREAGREPRDQK